MTQWQGDQPTILDGDTVEVARPVERPRRRWAERLGRMGRWVRAYFAEQDPYFWVAITPALLVATILFVRSPASNYIFDEQEALLANPYVNGSGLAFLDVFQRDFWGLPPTGSIGSYRPIPNMIWRVLWHVHHHPWVPHLCNVVVHALNASLLLKVSRAILA